MKIKEIFFKLPDYQPAKGFEDKLLRKITVSEKYSWFDFRRKFFKYLVFSMVMNLITIGILTAYNPIPDVKSDIRYKETFISVKGIKADQKYAIVVEEIFTQKKYTFDSKQPNNNLISLELTPGYYRALLSDDQGGNYETAVWVSSLDRSI